MRPLLPLSLAILLTFVLSAPALATCHFSAGEGANYHLLKNLDNVALVIQIDGFNSHFKEALGCHGHEKQCATRRCIDRCEPFMHSEQEIRAWYDSYPKAFLPDAVSARYADKISSLFVCPPARGPIKDDSPPANNEWVNTEPSGQPGNPHHEFASGVLTVFVTITMVDSKHPNQESSVPDTAILSQYLFRPGMLDSSSWSPPIATAISLNGKSDTEVTEEIQTFLNGRAFMHFNAFDAKQAADIISRGE